MSASVELSHACSTTCPTTTPPASGTTSPTAPPGGGAEGRDGAVGAPRPRRQAPGQAPQAPRGRQRVLGAAAGGGGARALRGRAAAAAAGTEVTNRSWWWTTEWSDEPYMATPLHHSPGWTHSSPPHGVIMCEHLRILALACSRTNVVSGAGRTFTVDARRTSHGHQPVEPWRPTSTPGLPI